MKTARPLRLDLHIRQGEFALDLQWSGEVGVLGLFGPSGSGKTTVLEAVAGIRRLTRGRIEFDGRVFDDTSAHLRQPSRERGVGYAPQDAALFPHLTVRANALYGAARAKDSALGAVFDLLEIGPLVDRRVQGLSGGERQRVALARALLSGPSLLLLDEPLAAVDLARRRRITTRLVEWSAARDLPMIHVSHDEAELAGADEVLVLTG
jgi:molybdate transport system ATP-binding protein